MKYLFQTFFMGVLICFLSFSFTQTTGDYQSKGNGNWKDASTWQRYNGIGWVNAATDPTSTNKTKMKNTYFSPSFLLRNNLFEVKQ